MKIIIREEVNTMAASKNFAKVKEFFNTGVWSEGRVKDAVVKNWITPEEYEEITGEVYV